MITVNKFNPPSPLPQKTKCVQNINIAPNKFPWHLRLIGSVVFGRHTRCYSNNKGRNSPGQERTDHEKTGAVWYSHLDEADIHAVGFHTHPRHGGEKEVMEKNGNATTRYHVSSSFCASDEHDQQQHERKAQAHEEALDVRLAQGPGYEVISRKSPIKDVWQNMVLGRGVGS